ncbi:MAG: glycosyltransferase [Planctomycetaceae bacterium]|nr:glycosyltransferase [Planctomycetales bacterium]MCB9923348.1 glycosyltransferase [Planctomycetaceae bacterium]
MISDPQTAHDQIVKHKQNAIGTGSARARAVLITCYMTGSTEGKNLGTAGYSHDFVAKLFGELLSRWGKVVFVPDPQNNLETMVQKTRDQGFDPVHLSVLPFQDVCLAQTIPNVVMPAWEFPDVPDHGFDDNPQNDWPATANRCDLVLVSGPFTEQALRRGQAKSPIRFVQVPTPDAYFSVPPWQSGQEARIECPAYIFPQPAEQDSATSFLGRAFEFTATQLRNWQRFRHARATGKMALPYESSPAAVLSGIVYTSVFNPHDGRKNWKDLLNAFLLGLGDKEDATLVLKLVTKNPEAVKEVVNYYHNRDVPHRCKLVVLCDFLSESQMCQLAAASTYYLQATKAEGNCLPLMNYLAAGRPGISPSHSAMSDYFDDSVGFVIESHPEPCAWPHDERLRLRSTWGRLVWPSIVEQLQLSYRLAKERPNDYSVLASRCRAHMHNWAGNEAVWERLKSALDALVNGELSRDSVPTRDVVGAVAKRVA